MFIANKFDDRRKIKGEGMPSGIESKKENLGPSVMHYIVDGSPIPLARARHGNGNTYDSQKQLKYSVGIQLRQQQQDVPIFTGPICLEVIFFMPIPDRIQKKIRKSADAQRIAPHSCKPDLSNLIKFIEDVATGIIYKDDSLISKIVAHKVYSMIPRTEFSVTQMVVL
jgi:Holliday junction resolvase RusA-like endonuclease